MIVVPYNICCALSVGATLVVAQFSFHMSPLWGFGYLVHAACYKHAAPLGLKCSNAPNWRRAIYRRGLVSKPSGLGDPTPTVSTVRWCLGILIRVLRPIRFNPRFRPMGHVAPLGLWCNAAWAAKLAACHLYHVSKPSGLGDPTPTVSTGA